MLNLENLRNISVNHIISCNDIIELSIIGILAIIMARIKILF